MTITGDRIRAKDPARDMGTGTYRLDATTHPGTLDTEGIDGPTRGKRYLGIYQLDGDTLRWCVGNPGRPRPTEFRTRTGDQRLMVLTRTR